MYHYMQRGIVISRNQLANGSWEHSVCMLSVACPAWHWAIARYFCQQDDRLPIEIATSFEKPRTLSLVRSSNHTKHAGGHPAATGRSGGAAEEL